MIKSELVQRIASQNQHLRQRDVEDIVDAVLDQIVEAMAGGDRVEVRGFGVFQVSTKVVPLFKTGKEMRERLNSDP